jgi:hypothetical protein
VVAAEISHEQAAPYKSAHRFCGHLGRVGVDDVPNVSVDIAFGLHPENANPTF